MCAIAGIYNLNSSLSGSQLTDIVRAMSGTMKHRGPDDEGIWLSSDNKVALAHQRLSILDTTVAGHQPMLDAKEQLAIVFNGEIYNFLDLREKAVASGHEFNSRSDTEVLLWGLATSGAEFLTYLDGMFALGLYDQQSSELLLARDPFGEKPLYYTFQNGLFAFSSELQALAQIPGFDPLITEHTIAQYLAFQKIPAPNTIYHHCFKLAPGHILRVNRQGVGTATRYHFWQTSVGTDDGALTLEQQTDQLHELLLSATRRRLISDVPVGAFLSGGVDSSTVVALMRKEIGVEVNSFSVGFTGLAESEHLEAREMSNILGTNHQDLMINPNDYGEFVELMGAVLDEPNVDSSCVPTYFISQLAKTKVTVALTGDGGDEMFGGYSRYLELIHEVKGKESLIEQRKWHVGRAYYTFLGQLFPDSYLREIFGTVPPMASDILLQARRQLDLDPRPMIHKLRQADVQYYLPVVLAKVDRMSMQHSLECRTPYLSTDVAAFAAKLSPSSLLDGAKGKLILRKVAARYIPESILNRPKKGFGIDPFNKNIKDSLLNKFSDLAKKDQLVLKKYISAEALQRLVEVNLKSWSFYHVWALLILEFWLKKNPNRSGK